MIWATIALQRLFHTQYQPIVRDAIIVIDLAQGHKCQDPDRNPHSLDSTFVSLDRWLWLQCVTTTKTLKGKQQNIYSNT